MVSAGVEVGVGVVVGDMPGEWIWEAEPGHGGAMLGFWVYRRLVAGEPAHSDYKTVNVK